MSMGPSSFCCLLLITMIIVAMITATSYVHAQRGSSGGGKCIAAERAALLSFKTGITSDPAKLLKSWRGDDCCSWSGVRCSNETGHVVRLDLRAAFFLNNETFVCCLPGLDTNSMLGEISSSLLALQHLKHLDLSGNYLGGVGVPIPSFLGSFKSLAYLNLACMNFDGRVPPQLGNLSRLQHLNLATYEENSLHPGDISWLRHLGLLQFLDMSGLNLTSNGDWVRLVTGLSSLKVLQLSGCGLSLPHKPAAHSNVSSLEIIDLSSNRVDTINPAYWFWDVQTIRELQLSRNQITGPFPAAIGNMTSLEVLTLGGNYISGVKSEMLKNSCNLRWLELWSNEINQDMTEFMEGLPRCTKSSLRILDLSATNITGGIPSWINHWSSLSSLQLSANRLEGSIPLEIGKLTNLYTLYLDNNQLNGSVSEEHFATLASLGQIDLSYNSIDITIRSDWVPPFSLYQALFARSKTGPHFPLWLKGQRDLEYLDISDAGIADNLPDWFWTVFSKVPYLNISCNQISGTLPVTLEFMTSAMTIDLNSNRLTGLLPQLPQYLGTLDISNNSLSGPLPLIIGAPMLTQLVLSINKINGTIPSYICELKYLEVLDLSDNNLVGKIPRCFNGSEAKKKLNMSTDSTQMHLSAVILYNNHLSGIFPEFLQHCQELTLLHLAHNKFVGELPIWIAEKLPRLTYLQLRYNLFSGSIPVQLTKLENLRNLDLAYNRISGSIPPTLGGLKAMVQSNSTKYTNPLVWNYYRPRNPDDFNDGYYVKYLNSLLVVVKGQELYYTSTLIYMVGLDLSCNNLGGDIPEEITSLVGLKNLNFSHNHLTGKIPEKIGHNHLTGKIPEKIGLLKHVESLDLSFNRLSSEIPSSLSDMVSLSYLNLSFNNLSGEYHPGISYKHLVIQISYTSAIIISVDLLLQGIVQDLRTAYKHLQTGFTNRRQVKTRRDKARHLTLKAPEFRIFSFSSHSLFFRFIPFACVVW
uniref:non-specific serine/threonine protein kinase n=1 Tax=Oryza punctata TaxID=4537 RepID=A0A0E0JKW2_ORYPU